MKKKRVDGREKSIQTTISAPASFASTVGSCHSIIQNNWDAPALKITQHHHPFLSGTKTANALLTFPVSAKASQEGTTATTAAVGGALGATLLLSLLFIAVMLRKQKFHCLRFSGRSATAIHPEVT